MGKSLKTAALAGVAAMALLAGAAYAFTGIHLRPTGTARPAIPVVTESAGPAAPAASQLVYTDRTANDAAVTLPAVVQDNLLSLGLAHRSVELTRIGYTGAVTNSSIDLTPRTGNSSRDPALKVRDRAVPVIDAKISGIGTAINTPRGSAGGRALYTGLTRTDFTGVPVTIVSSGLDLADPDDFRVLNWTVSPAQVVADVKKYGDQPKLHGPVTFVLVPVAGAQPQLAQSQKDYLEDVWRALLTAAGATSVTFIDAGPAVAGPAAPGAPAVSVPGPPPTPIEPKPTGPGQVTCTVPASYFVYNTATLIAPAQTMRNLSSCITRALAAHATFALDGWTSYEGPLDASGRPASNDPANITLSQKRVQAIADLLIDGLDVPRSAITRMTGHGNFGQPEPDPRSAANRVVVITYTTK
jgi:hypothetical protein